MTKDIKKAKLIDWCEREDVALDIIEDFTDHGMLLKPYMDRYAGGDVRLNTYEIKCANKNRDGIRSTIADYIIQLEENGILTINTEQL